MVVHESARVGEGRRERIDLSVIVPVFNEEESIAPLVKALMSVLERTGRDFEIIFVDDDLNGFSRKAKERCLDLFRAMAAARLDKRWITQVTVNFNLSG